MFYKESNADGHFPISVLLPFRNEEENLSKNLPSLLSCADAEFEVVAVDDFSSDNSYLIISNFLKKHKNLKISSLNQETRFSEKLSRNIAIKAAQYDWVVLVPPTADFSEFNWLPAFSSKLSDNYEVIAGYSGLKPNGSLCNLIYRAESFFQQITSFGFIINGMPYVINEENVAFKKYNYFNIGGYGKSIKESNFNFELLINTFIKKRTALLLLSGEYSLRMSKKISLSEVYQLLVKEFRFKKYLSFRIRLTRWLSDVSNILFLPVAAIAFIFVIDLWPVITVFMLIYLVAYLVIIKKILLKLEERKLFLPSLLVALLRPYIKLLLWIWHYITDQKK